MNEKTRKTLVKVRNKVEDGIVKTKEFIEKHPIACAIGGTAASAVIAGAIGKAIGYRKGVDDGVIADAKDWNEWLTGGKDLGTVSIIADKCITDDSEKFNKVAYASALLDLNNGEKCVIAKDPTGTVAIDRILNGAIAKAIDERFSTEVPKAPTFTHNIDTSIFD